MSYLKRTLLVVGPVLEGFGIVVILFPDVIPELKQSQQWIQKRARTLASSVLRLFRIPRNIRIVGAVGSAASLAGVRGRVVLSPGENASLEQKVRFLIERYPEIDAAIDGLQERLEKSEKETANRFEQTKQEVEAWTHGAIKAEIDRFRRVRIFGSCLLFAGLVCAAFTNFIE